MIEYISRHSWLAQIVITVPCPIIELGSGDFFVTYSAIDALGATASSLFDMPLWPRIIVFAVCSMLSLMFVRPPPVHVLHASDDNRVGGTEALVGRVGMVEEPITGKHSGYVKTDGDVWKVVSTDLETIRRDERVHMVKMDSIILIVGRCL